MGEIKFITSLVFIALFSIAIFTYVINYTSDNNSVVNLDNEQAFEDMSTSVKNNITQFSIEDVNDSSSSFFPSEITPGDDVMNSGQTFKIGLRSLVKSVSSIRSLASVYLFGNNPAFNTFLTVLYSMLIFIGIRYIYKSWVGKNPD